MTIQHKIAGGLVVFALFAWVMAPLVATPASAVATKGQDVSIAISSGPQLRLIEQTATNQPAISETRGLLCQRVYRFAFADIGVKCTPAGQTQQIVRLRTD